MRKRLLGFILAVSTLLVLTPDTVMAARMEEKPLQVQETAAQAADEGTTNSASDMVGDGTETTPYRIKNAEQLRVFTDKVNGVNGAPDTGLCAVLMCDIDLSGVCGADIGSWTPIGTSANPYTGIFDGGSFAITGLYYHNSNSSYGGLFGNNAGIIKNLGVAGTDVSAGSYTGGVCGYNSGTITGCYNAASVKGNDYTGGVCGYNNVGGTVSVCYNIGAVSGRKYVGGICGYNKNTTANCYNMGAINGKRTSIGGICGYNRASVSNCFNTGAITNGGRKYIGSICGYNHSQSSFLNCYYLITGEEKGNYGVGMTQEQFASGEVCWLLNEGRIKNVVWHQTCGAGFPAFGGKVVYQVRRQKTGGSADEIIVSYTNEEEKKQASIYTSSEENDADNTSNENPQGHVYQLPEWEWKGYKSAKAVFTCQDCGETLSLEAAISKKTTEATCGKEGKIVYTASVDRDGETYTDQKTEKLEKSDHKTIVSEQKREATCEKVGIKEACWRCSDCGTYFSDSEGKIEIPRETVEIPAKGHQYGEPKWEWNVKSNPLVAVAVFSCDNGCGTIEKRDGKVSSETDATCTTAGNTVYTAVVTFNGETYEAKETVSGKPLPHSYGKPEWKWADDYSTAKAVFTCEKCNYTVTQDATLTSEKTADSTCEVAGNIKHTAVVELDGRKYSDVKNEPLPKADHRYNGPEWTWAPDYESATATFTCADCGTSVSETAKVEQTETLGTNCSMPGKITYTATVTFRVTGKEYTDTKEKEIPEDHKLESVAAKEPGCETDGNEEYWECSVCHQKFGDEAGSEKITDIPVIPATGHKLEIVKDKLYKCTVCDKTFTITLSPDGTPTMYSVEEDAVIPQGETVNSEERQEDSESQAEDEQDEKISQGKPEVQDGETGQNEPEGQNEQDIQSEQDGLSRQNEQNAEENSGDIPDMSENAARYGLIYPEGEEADSVTTDAWEGNAINLRAEAAGKTAPQIVREQQQQQGYPLWVSVAVLTVLAGVVLVILCKRKVIDEKR